MEGMSDRKDGGGSEWVEWEVIKQEVVCGEGGCSAAVCRPSHDVIVGPLSEAERKTISHHLQILRSNGDNLPTNIDNDNLESNNTEDLSSRPAAGSTSTLRCSKPERESLQQALVSWHDTYWASVKSKFPFFSRHWILTDENLGRLVERAHVILNATEVNISVIRGLIRTTADDATLESLVGVLNEFCQAR
ncbi:unnamed protein product [Cyclocybe aegerita]|uniref:Uncharacterized protein n=1 Tax=Cyclocybe aegerita TaxID=1973307 RepID=A0A8S0VZN9_CYCAE|nr:unnamed protein product [Cyclocybe aegerita]